MLGSVPTYRVTVPFQAVIHESLDSRVLTELPDTDVTPAFRIKRTASEYVAIVDDITVDGPAEAKSEAADLVDRFLAILAIGNYAFQVRIGGVESKVVDDSSPPATVVQAGPHTFEVLASDTIHMESHVQVVMQKANLDQESDLLHRYESLASFVKNCIELNHLLVMSTRSLNRWLLAVIGLETLAGGVVGPQKTISARLAEERKSSEELVAGIATVADNSGIGELAQRMTERVLSTTLGPVADQIHAFFEQVSISNVSRADIRKWWSTRGSIAHGGAPDIDPGDLNHLITVFQTALRRVAGSEAS